MKRPTTWRRYRTCSLTWVECTRVPLVPVTVIVYVPLATPLVDTFIVEEPEPDTDAGEKVGFVPDQLPLNCTAPVKPPAAVTVTVYLAAVPCRPEPLVGDAPMRKSAGTALTGWSMPADVL